MYVRLHSLFLFGLIEFTVFHNIGHKVSYASYILRADQLLLFQERAQTYIHKNNTLQDKSCFDNNHCSTMPIYIHAICGPGVKFVKN